MRDIFLSHSVGMSLWVFFVASNTVSVGTRTKWAWQGLGRVFTLLSLSDGQSLLDVMTWFLPRYWVIAKIGKELKFVPSAQTWGTDLPNSLVPGSGDKRSCLFPKVSITSQRVWDHDQAMSRWEPSKTQPCQSEMAHIHSVACSSGFTVNVVLVLGLNFMILKVLSHLNNLGFCTWKKNQVNQILVLSRVSEVLTVLLGYISFTFCMLPSLRFFFRTIFNHFISWNKSCPRFWVERRLESGELLCPSQGGMRRQDSVCCWSPAQGRIPRVPGFLLMDSGLDWKNIQQPL